MSTKFKGGDTVPTQVLAARLKELSDYCTKNDMPSEFSMRIPCELDRDADVVMGEASRRLMNLERELSASRSKAVETGLPEGADSQIPQLPKIFRPKFITYNTPEIPESPHMETASGTVGVGYVCDADYFEIRNAAKKWHGIAGQWMKECAKLLGAPIDSSLPEGCPSTGYWTPHYHLIETLRLDEPQITQHPVEIHPTGSRDRLRELEAILIEAVGFGETNPLSFGRWIPWYRRARALSTHEEGK